MQHSAARKYVSPYARIGECYSCVKGFYTGLKHERGNVDFWGARKCRKPKIAYTILRIAKARAGQLELFPVLRKKVRRSKKAKRLMYV